MPEYVERGIRLKHRVIRGRIATVVLVLENSSSVHQGRQLDECYFIVDAEIVRVDGLLESEPIRYVNAVVELYMALCGAFL
jgi:hypothetical protein